VSPKATILFFLSGSKGISIFYNGSRVKGSSGGTKAWRTFAVISKGTDDWDAFTVDEEGNSRFPVSGTKDLNII